jgi:Asp-tRNA(Asn)/Glu-tRNA(Gln) amidotransferase A subunit family amidase
VLTAQLTAASIAAAVRARELSPVEVVEAHLERLGEANTELNAIVTVTAEQARADARRLEHDPAGALAGVPFTAKDVIATAGVRTTAGSRVLANHVPECDATVVARLRAAGAILMGKGNCSEFALWPHTTNPLFGDTRNPVGPISPGGSSGGDAVAVAAEIVPLAVGGDFGGSLRWPAHCTGIAALRPTAGRVPRTGEIPGCGSISLQGRVSVLGPLARSVDDLEVALNVLAGPDGVDPLVVPAPLGRVEGVEQVAWCDGDGTTPVRSDLVDVVQFAATAVGAEYCRPPGLECANEVYSRLRSLDGLHELRTVVAGREDELGQSLRSLLAETRAGTMAELVELWAERDALRARFLTFLDLHPVLILPVAAVPAYDPGIPPVVDEHELSPWDVLAPCRAVSLFGVPSAAVTIGTSRDGLPAAVQIVGRPFREDDVLAVARALEVTVPFSHHTLSRKELPLD